MRTTRILLLVASVALAGDAPGRREHVEVRGIYGGLPTTLMEKGRTLEGAGVNAVWIGERGITKERVERLEQQGARVFAEFNTLHRADYLKDHPDAAPVGIDGEPSPPPRGWQGICPTHEGYRKWRMDAFRRLLTEFGIDGVWLDYHHAHASWERADPVLPDTCYCTRCLEAYGKDPAADREAWIRWRCGIFTDWVREFRSIVDETRPQALLGTFHCPWSDDRLRDNLAIDLREQAKYIDVFSPMVYHARFGHADDPAWIARQTKWLGDHLGVKGVAGERIRIWPIVQITDWGESVPVERIGTVLDYGTRPPATGVMVFRWGPLRKRPDKLEAMVRVFRRLAGAK